MPLHDVEGIFLLNVRPKESESDRNDPDWANAALPKEPAEDGYVDVEMDGRLW